ncbi:MAG: alpha-2-macroglobulin [Spirochaetaceae bacterium]|jgi:uncharacterized protein YfaS (alpha-2-macroglobulin family)|nr:alpha-2-macroglobulin [Spirochaetaceae bacterium]
MKYKLIGVSLVLVVFLTTCANQTKKNDNGTHTNRGIPNEAHLISAGNGDIENGIIAFANDQAIKTAFTLDYRSQKPEPLSAAETLSMQELSGGAGKSFQGSSTGSGLRPLSDYKTAYFDPLKNAERFAQIQAAQAKNAGGTTEFSKEPLTIVDHGPQNFLSSDIQRPSVYVIFSQPMIPLAALGTPSADSPFMQITPPLKGSFRWYGTSFLSFESEEPGKSQQLYTVTIDPSTRSLYGNTISGVRQFQFETERLSLKSLSAGEKWKKETGFQFTENDVPPEAAKNIDLLFNYPVKADDIKKFIKIETSSGEKRFSLDQINDYKIAAHVSDPVEFNTKLTVTLLEGAKSGNGTLGTRTNQSLSFKTPGPFKLKKYDKRTAGREEYAVMFDLEFSVRLNEKSALSAISVESLSDLNDKIEVFDNIIRVFNLPFTYNESFKIKIGANLEDVYGRKFGQDEICLVTMPPPPPPMASVKFSSEGQKMLEAQFPPRLLFEHSNIGEPSWYSLQSKENPYSPVAQKTDRYELKAGEKNNSSFQEVDLSPYLNAEGRGFVTFNAFISLPRGNKYRNWKTGEDVYEDTIRENELTTQVTDLGLTARLAFNKVVVLVTRLSTGEPVEGALVKLISPQLIEGAADINAVGSFGQTLSDKNGAAVIDLAQGVYRAALESYWHTPFVFAEKDGDRVVFSPYSHNSYAFDIYSSSPAMAEGVEPVTFLFSDRGLYKPGETLTFRGVDRSLILGQYAIYSGNYTISLQEERWEGKTIKTIEGVARESGSFFGSIDIPDDLSPGSYRLIYQRGSVSDESAINYISANIPVAIAFFQRAQFQASISSPHDTLILGDDINVKLQASYLSGGSLAGAKWNASWFRELSHFTPKDPDLQKYTFGPRNAYDGNSFINVSEGVLAGDGTARLDQKTGELRVSGAPYRYAVEASVTDISNQMISASNSMIVHPALYYIGIEKPSGGGFAQSGTEIHLNYIVLSPEAQKLSSSAAFKNNGKNGALNVELIRQNWNRVQQRGVNGYMYDKYTEDLITESQQKIDLSLSGGTVKVKPLKGGFYIARLSSEDRDGRKVLSEYGFYVSGSDWGFWNMENAEEIHLNPDKGLYNPGETAQVMMQSPLPAGRYLITVEREGIFTEEVKVFDQAINVIEIPIARNFVPLVYVSISSYSIRTGPPTHSYGSPDLDKPKGYFGVTKLYVNQRVRAFSVKVTSDKKSYHPGEEVTITLHASRDGKPLANAELTLMAVDRGVIDLIDYHVPDPIEYFYNEGRFNLKVNGGDSRALLMDPVTYSVKRLRNGDSLMENGKMEERKDFTPTAVFEPCLISDAKGQVVYKFTLPDTLTTYRISVFGIQGDLFALQESEIAAQNKINVQEVLPRRLRERDSSEIGLRISNLDSASHKLTVSMSLGEAVKDDFEQTNGLSKKSGEAFIDGESERSVSLKSGENTVVYFDLAAVREGYISLTTRIKSDILNEILINELYIERPSLTETVTATGTVSASSAREAIIIPSYADNGEGEITVSLDASRLSLLESAVNYLFDYPYGCLEQRSAAILPLVLFGDYLDAFNMGVQVKNPKKVVENEIKTWVQSQRPDGGFPYWPDGNYSDTYVSLRIAYICALAKAKNYDIPLSLDQKALYRYLNSQYADMGKSRERYLRLDPDYLQACTLYVLSLAGEVVDPSRIAEILARDNIEASVLAFCGMSYRNVGRKSEAASVALRLRNLLRPTTRGVDLTINRDAVNTYSPYYNDSSEQLALVLQFFADQFPGDAINTRLVYSLLQKKRTDGSYSNTAVTARVLAALAALIESENLVKTDVSAAITLAGRDILSGSFKGAGAKPETKKYSFKDFPLAAMPRDTLLNLDVARAGVGDIYWTASLVYALPNELQSYRDEGISLFYTVHDLDSGEEIKGAALASGKTYRAKVRISSNRDRNYLALRVPVPSGAEILDAAFAVNPRLSMEKELDDTDSNDEGEHWISRQSIMDNEIRYFWDNFSKGETSVQFLFRAGRRGVFPTPPLYAECMYEPEIFGRTSGLLYTIK